MLRDTERANGARWQSLTTDFGYKLIKYFSATSFLAEKLLALLDRPKDQGAQLPDPRSTHRVGNAEGERNDNLLRISYIRLCPTMFKQPQQERPAMLRAINPVKSRFVENSDFAGALISNCGIEFYTNHNNKETVHKHDIHSIFMSQHARSVPGTRVARHPALHE